jgi:hypothetical protein
VSPTAAYEADADLQCNILINMLCAYQQKYCAGSFCFVTDNLQMNEEFCEHCFSETVYFILYDGIVVITKVRKNSHTTSLDVSVKFLMEM